MSDGWKRPESVLVVIGTRNGDVLLMERREPKGFWQSVTGSLELDETPAEAAARELREETGIEARPEDCHLSQRFPIVPPWKARYAPDVTYNLEHAFRLILPEKLKVRLNPKEHLAALWLSRGEAIRRASSWSNSLAIEHCLPE